MDKRSASTVTVLVERAMVDAPTAYPPTGLAAMGICRVDKRSASTVTVVDVSAMVDAPAAYPPYGTG